MLLSYEAPPGQRYAPSYSTASNGARDVCRAAEEHGW